MEPLVETGGGVAGVFIETGVAPGFVPEMDRNGAAGETAGEVRAPNTMFKITPKAGEGWKHDLFRCVPRNGCEHFARLAMFGNACPAQDGM